MVASAKGRRKSPAKAGDEATPKPRKKRAASKAKPKSKAKVKATAKPGAKKRPSAKKKSAATEVIAQPRPRKRIRWRKHALRAAKWSGIAAAVFFVSTFLWAFAYRWIDPPRTPLMLTRAVFDGSATNYTWRDIDSIAPEMTLAVIAAEDQRFFLHRGFDFVEMRRAWEAHQDGARLRGASTLSQQTAKNVFLLPTRSWIRKGLEVYFTGLIELLWGKERILEVYLNIAETGPGYYGVESAAQHYFNVSTDTISRERAAAIAAVLPNPRLRNPATPSAEVQRRQQWILKQMRNLGGDAWLAPLSR